MNINKSITDNAVPGNALLLKLLCGKLRVPEVCGSMETGT